jgi:hypothetical protein
VDHRFVNKPLTLERDFHGVAETGMMTRLVLFMSWDDLFNASTHSVSNIIILILVCKFSSLWLQPSSNSLIAVSQFLTMPDNKSAVGRVGSAPTKLSVYCSYVFCKNRAEEVNERKSDSTLLISAAGRGRPSAGDLQLMGRSSSCCFFAPLGFLEPKKNCWVCDQLGGIIL